MPQFDPHEDTNASLRPVDGDDPFADWPTRSLMDPMGEVQGFARLSRAVNNSRGRPRGRTGRAFVLAILLTMAGTLVAAVVLDLIRL